jgi:uncharacterized protein YlxW (UPF0749 family)
MKNDQSSEQQFALNDLKEKETALVQQVDDLTKQLQNEKQQQVETFQKELQKHEAAMNKVRVQFQKLIFLTFLSVCLFQ